MRFNNGSLQKWVPLVYFFLFLGILLSVLVYGVMMEEKSANLIWYVLPTVGFLLLFAFVYKVVAFFEYDSDGEVLNFINKGLMLSNFMNYREKRAEFPRDKLKDFKIINYVIYRNLRLLVSSRSGRTKKLHFNITFLNARKRKALYNSLDQVVKHNQEVDGRKQ